MNITYRWTRDDDSEVEIDVEFQCSPYDPGRTSGPPELCYEPEGGEVEKIKFFAGSNCTPEELAEFERLYYQGGKLRRDVDDACSVSAIDRAYDGPNYY